MDERHPPLEQCSSIKDEKRFQQHRRASERHGRRRSNAYAKRSFSTGLAYLAMHLRDGRTRPCADGDRNVVAPVPLHADNRQ